MLKKDLYVANSLDELNVRFETSVDDKVRNRSITQILSSGKKLIDHADKFYREGDEEQAYIFYGRYLNLIFQLQKKPDYTQQKEYISKTLGGNPNQSKVITRLESLKKSLKSRYEEKDKTLTPAAIPVTPMDSEEQIPEVRHSISCYELYGMMEKESSKFIILDCRTEEDFQQSRIVFNFICNVPESICQIGMSENKVKLSLPNESKVFWEMRKNRQIIVFVDWGSTSFRRNTPIWHLRQILLEWDIECEKKPEMILLEGGFERWLTTYPMKCSDPRVKVPQEGRPSLPSMEGIEYPNLDDITMKDTSNKAPVVDRSTKNKAMRKSELLELKEELMDKSLQNDKELLELESAYVSNKENEDDPRSQDVIYKILELRTKKKDVDIKNENIDKEIEIAKNEPVKPSEMSKVEDLEIRLKQKEDEIKKYQPLMAERDKLFDEALRKARETKSDFNKTLMKTPGKGELILSPRNLNSQNNIPHFDRASKPITVSNQGFYDNQDFSPVHGRTERGLTGLKNLGNTCYMNSVLQCLSNTITLTHFILEGVYEKYINRTNNTKGHIIRTLAALVKMLWRGDCKYISSKHLKAVIGEQENLFYGFDQQDAHEFLIMLIDWLQSDLQTIHMPTDSMDDNASEKAWLEYTKAKESFILRLFYGQIKSTLKCTVCGEESASHETFSNLSLELPPINIDRDYLSQCFNSYFHGEKINGWNCPKCNVPRDAVKKLDISKLPPVLIIHLKRFYADPYSHYRKKTAYVDFPLTNLDMLPYVAPKERANITPSSRPYNLYAVTNHYGTLESGHYTAFCLNARQKKWYKFDDQNVTQIDRGDVRSSSAYVLFYTNLSDTNYIN